MSRHNDIDRLLITPQITAILSYENVHFNSIDLEEFSTGTPLENFMMSGRLHSSIFAVSHTSDALRLLVLWRYGGTYLDTDMIVRQKLDSIPSNYACHEVAEGINGAILNLSDDEDGRQLAETFMINMIENFNGTVWGSNGPLLMTRVLQDLCKTNSTKEMIAMKSCEGFHVLPKQLCYAVNGLSWPKLFNETSAEWAMKKVENSLVVHFWNNLSRKTPLSVNSTAAYIQLAKLHCPKVIASCDDSF